MKYLHICMPSKRMMNTFIKMVRDNCKTDEHRFLLWDKCALSDKDLYKYGNVTELDAPTKYKNLGIMKHEMEMADVIIWHGLICTGTRLLFLALHPSFLRKSVWIIHGIDLINYIREDKGLVPWVINLLSNYVRKRIPYVVCLTPEDREIYEEKFFNSKKHVYTIFKPIGKDTFDRLLSLRNPLPRNNGRIYIQVAHNAYTFNNHVTLLHYLEKFSKIPNARVVIPMSYGNDWINIKKDYKEEVTSLAHSIFGNRAIVIDKLMPIEEYDELLWNVDISIFGALRQNAFGNIIRLLLFGNKVFLPKNSPLYHFFSENGITVFPTENIEKMSFSEFCKPQPCTDAVATFLCKSYHPDCSFAKWNYLFQDVAYHLHLTTALPECIDEEKINKLANQILSEHKIARKRKANYICLQRYMLQKKGTVLKDCRNIIIMGCGDLAISLNFALKNDNAKSTRWFLYGFSGYVKSVNCDTFDEDSIGTPETSRIDNVMYLSAVENPYERELFATILGNRGAIFRNYAYPGALCTVKSVGMGCIFGSSANINFGTKIGSHTYIFGGRIERGVTIGNFVTIDRGTTIEKYATVGDYVIIGKRVHIAAGIKIGKGVIIPDDTQVTKDIPDSVIKDLSFVESNKLKKGNANV